jgi:hypothetical protein
MKKYSREDHITLAYWAAACAERVLSFFEKAYPGDDRPRKAIETGRDWARTGIFKMAEIRGASLAAHAAARAAKANATACFAARAAGQAVATAHVPQHALGGAYYALKTVAAGDPAHADLNVAKEFQWQSAQLPEHLRNEIRDKIIIENRKNGVFIKIKKGDDF